MTPLPSSRLSRELGAPIYSFNFGSRTRKPRYLHPLHIHGKDTLFPDLVAVAGKESGMMYYSASHLSKSATACSVLRGCDNVRKAYSRLPLAHSIPFRLKPRCAQPRTAVLSLCFCRGSGIYQQGAILFQGPGPRWKNSSCQWNDSKGTWPRLSSSNENHVCFYEYINAISKMV